MKLRRLTFKGPDYSEEKSFSEDGKILSEKSGNSKKTYQYDKLGRIEKISEIVPGEWMTRFNYEHNYEYDRDDYRIITILKEQIGEDSDYDGYAGLTEEKKFNINKITKVEECKFKNKKLVSIRISDLFNNRFNNKFYIFKGDKLIEEVNEDNDDKKTIKFNYLDDNLVEKLIMGNGDVVSKKQFIYQDNLLICEQTIDFYNKTIEYISFQKKFHYNDSKELIKTEYFGRYDTAFELYQVDETIQKVDSVIEKGGQTHYDHLGYYSLEELNATKEKEQEDEVNNYDEVTLSILGSDCIDRKFVPFEPRENKSFNYSESLSYCREIFYESGIIRIKKDGSIVKNNKSPIKIISYNPVDEHEVYDTTYYHYEFNEEVLVEFEICFMIRSNSEYEHVHTKKYYYY